MAELQSTEPMIKCGKPVSNDVQGAPMKFVLMCNKEKDHEGLCGIILYQRPLPGGWHIT